MKNELSRREERPRSSTLWSNVPNRPDNPLLVVAQILSDKGHPVWLDHNAETSFGEPLANKVAIHASSDGKDALNKVKGTVELSSLIGVDWYVNRQPETNIGKCDWDEDTKKRVLATDLDKRVKFYRASLHYYPSGHIRSGLLRSIEESQEKMKELLEDRLQILSPEDIRLLVEQVVDRELPPQR